MLPALRLELARGMAEFDTPWRRACGHNRAMSLAPPEADGPLRRERLRTARLYFVCEARPGGEDPEALLRAALSGGVDIVQLREKELGRAEIERAAATFRRLCDTYSALFIVNDDPELARAATPTASTSARTTCSADEARALLGPDAIIGLSTHSGEQIDAAAERRSTTSASGRSGRRRRRRGDPAVGLELISHAAEHAAHPLFAIGGIDAGNAEQVVARRGAAALRGARDPRRRRPRRRRRTALRGAVGVGTRWRAPRARRSGPMAQPRAQAQAARRDARRRAMARGYAKAEAAQPGGARSAGAAGRGERPTGGHGRRRRRRPVALSIVVGYLAGVEVDGEKPRSPRSSRRR